MRKVCREVASQTSDYSAKETVELAKQIVDDGAPGVFGVAYELLRYHPTAISAVTTTDLRQLGRTMASWGDVDCFSVVAGYAWRSGRVSENEIHRWARSKNRWWRRAALVSTVPLNMKSHGGTGDVGRTLGVCQLLVDDRDDMVIKAMSWALRALSTWEPVEVEGFLDHHRTELAPRVIREVENKLRTGRKDGRKSKRASS